MTAHATNHFLLPTADTIVAGLGSENGWVRKGGGEPEEPTRKGLSDPEQPWLSSVLEDIKAIAALGEDWDGYGAGQIRSDVLWYTLRLLQSVMEDFPAPHVIPMSHEGIMLEWLSEGVRLEIEIEDAGEAYISYENENAGIDDSWEVRSNFSSLLEPLRAVAGKAPSLGAVVS